MSSEAHYRVGRLALVSHPEGGFYKKRSVPAKPSFAEFELAKADEPSQRYPQHRELIGRLCRS